MSVAKLKADLEFGEGAEKEVAKFFESKGYKVEMTKKTAIVDFVITKGKKQLYVELKTRRNTKDCYTTTMIGLNKLIEAYKIYDKSGDKTLFFFSFTDGLYYIDPFATLAEFEHKAGRWDRGGIDKKKGWALYPITELRKLINN